MCGIHLNNNNITNLDYFRKVLDLFYITNEDLIACNRSNGVCAKSELIHPDDVIDYDEHLRPYFCMMKPEDAQKAQIEHGHHPTPRRHFSSTTSLNSMMNRSKRTRNENLLRKHKDHILAGKEMRILE